MKSKFEDRLNLKERKKFWDRRINIAHRKINRKKHYGIETEINKYQEAVNESVDISDALEVLRNNKKESFKSKEKLIDKLMDLISMKSLSSDNKLFAKVRGVFSDSFKKGTRRLFKKNGDRVDVEQFEDEGTINNMMQDQDEYFENMQSEAQDKMQKTLRDGYSEGKSTDEIADDLEREVDEFTKNRAKTVADSELTKATSEGTKASMEKAGIQKFMWLSARNEDVCKGENFEENFNGETFTNCRDYDGTTWNKDGLHPMPVKHSHPNCRCCLTAVVD